MQMQCSDMFVQADEHEYENDLNSNPFAILFSNPDKHRTTRICRGTNTLQRRSWTMQREIKHREAFYYIGMSKS